MIMSSIDPCVRFSLTGWSGVAEQCTWTGYQENDTAIGTATGDVTSLLQDTIDYAAANGLPFRGSGRTYNSSGVAGYLCTYGTITIPPNICNVMLFDNCCILARPADGGPALVFNSFEDLTFEHRGGQVVYTGDSAIVLFQPKNLVPADNAVTMNLGKIKFQALTVQAGTNPCVMEFDPTMGHIWGMKVCLGEVDCGGHGNEAIRVLNPSPTTFFQDNCVEWLIVCNSLRAAIQEGMGFANQANIRRNTWRGNCIEPGAFTSDGFNTFGSLGRLEVTFIGDDEMAAGLNRGIVLEPGSQGYRYSYVNIAGAATNVVDAGTGNVQY
jgi:hypothetical protein